MLDQIGLAQMVTRNMKTEKGTYLQKLDTCSNRSDQTVAALPIRVIRRKLRETLLLALFQEGFPLIFFLRSEWKWVSVGGDSGC